MLDNYLLDLPAICLIRSDRIFDRILYQLSRMEACSHGKELENEALNTLLDYHTHRFRMNDFEKALNKTYSDRTSLWGYSLEFLGGIFDRYFEFSGRVIEARPNMLNQYSALCSKIHPATMVGYKLARYLCDGQLHVGDVEQFVLDSDPLMLPNSESLEPYADNHVHMGGVAEAAGALMRLACEPLEPFQNKRKASLPRVCEFSYINNNTYPPDKLLAIYRELFRLINQWVLSSSSFDTARLRLILSMKESFPLGGDVLYSNLHNGKWDSILSAPPQQLLLLSSQAFSENRYSDALFFYFTMVFLLYESEESPVQVHQAALAFIHLINILRSYMVMRGVGLKAFVGYFKSPVRNIPGSGSMDYASRSLFNPSENMVEIKTGFSMAGTRRLQKAMQAFYKLHDAADEKPGSDSLDKLNGSLSRYHYCLHFSRSGEDKAFEGNGRLPLPIRYLHKRKDAEKNANKVHRLLLSPLAQRLPAQEIFYPFAGAAASTNGTNKGDDVQAYFEKKDHFKGYYLNSPRLIRGLDVAGDENDAPVEVFAPVIRWLRHQPKSFGESYDQASKDLKHSPKLHLSVHAGEDFDHLLTGLRKIDETVFFCGYRHGDRIGHGLALGIRPKDWAGRQSEIFISRQDHLDNLVWAWHYAVEMGTTFPAAQGIALQYEQRIRDHSEKVFGEAVLPGELFKGWKLRRNDPERLMAFQTNRTSYSDLEAWVPDYRDISVTSLYDTENRAQNESSTGNRANMGDSGYRAPKVYLDYLTNQNVRIRGNEVVTLRFDQYPLNDPDVESIGPEELDYFEALQDFLMTKYDRAGISVEANPSSNIYIGWFADYAEHPIFRWHPPLMDDLLTGASANRFGLRNGPLKVCINTDDPGIFPTNLHNEYRLVKEAAMRKFDISQLEAKQWIERIRREGVEIFRHAHSKVLYKRPE